jgi:hypothetical protein
MTSEGEKKSWLRAGTLEGTQKRERVIYIEMKMRENVKMSPSDIEIQGVPSDTGSFLFYF